MATVLSLAPVCVPVETPELKLDHIWIMVSPGAPERAALEKAGFQIAPTINRHDGQGTASVTAEFENGFLELMWPDSTVPLAPEYERAAEKFRQRMLWRTSGWCPIGIGLRRTSSAQGSLPFPTWSVKPGWLPAGSAIEMLTPRDDTKSPSLFIGPKELLGDEAAIVKAIHSGSPQASMYIHPNGVHRVTAMRLLSPKTYQPIEPLTYLEKLKVFDSGQNDEWLVELTFDNGQKRKTADLRPQLPLVVRY
ncbi:MAG TPA: VOC family protein [Candidatus Angelobacter sp.]|jgi:hypothetical protein